MGAHLAYGFISEVIPEKGMARVEFREHDTNEDNSPLVSQPMPISVRKSQDDKETFPYDIGEQVWCIMEDENYENGIIGGALYNDEDLPDGAGPDIYRIKFKDGSYVEFDRSSGNYTLHLKGDYILETDGDASVHTDGNTVFNGGSNSGIVKVSPLTTKLNNIENKINQLITVFNTWVPVANDGGAALKAALTAWLSSTLNITLPADIKNDKVQH